MTWIITFSGPTDTMDIYVDGIDMAYEINTQSDTVFTLTTEDTNTPIIEGAEVTLGD